MVLSATVGSLGPVEAPSRARTHTHTHSHYNGPRVIAARGDIFSGQLLVNFRAPFYDTKSELIEVCHDIPSDGRLVRRPVRHSVEECHYRVNEWSLVDVDWTHWSAGGRVERARDETGGRRGWSPWDVVKHRPTAR